MKVKSKLKNLRISPRKVRLVSGLIKDMDAEDALNQLQSTVKRSSPVIEKMLKSAIASAENNWGMDKDNLYVYDIQVGEGYRMKRWMPRAYGRATPILKRTSSVILTLEERVEGKNRKSKDQMNKEKKEREEKKKKLEKDMTEQREKEKGDTEKKGEIPFREKRTEAEQKKGEKKGWMKKMFQRKAG